jgi:multidrug efflux pump subunit AcrA (membrane-fusion protein)
MKKIISNKKAVIVGIILLIIGLGYYLSGRGSGGKSETLTIMPHEFIQKVSVSGKVIASDKVDLGFTESGRVAHVYAAVGQRVQAGVLLAEIENGDIRAALLQKEAYLESQRSKLESLKKGARPEEVAVAESTVARDRTAESEAKLSVVNAVRDAYVKADDAVHNTIDQFMRNSRSPSPELVFSTSASQTASKISAERSVAEFMLAKWQSEALNASANGDVEALAEKANKNLVSVAFLLADASAVLSQSLPSQVYTETVLHGYAGDVATARTIINTSVSISEIHRRRSTRR